MLSLFSDATFWVLISTVCCVALIVKYAKQVVLDSLDDRSDKIRQRLEDAEKLKSEAQELLAQFQRKHRDAMKEADSIIAEAQQRVEQERHKAKLQLAENIKLYETQAKQRIARVEEETVAAIKGKIADLAVQKATKKLEVANLDKLGTDDTIKRTVDAVKKTLH